MKRCGSFCPCIPGSKPTEAKGEESSSSSQKTHKSRRNRKIKKDRYPKDEVEGGHQGATNASSNDTGAGVAVAVMTAGHVSAMEGSACGSSHGGGGGGGDGGG